MEGCVCGGGGGWECVLCAGALWVLLLSSAGPLWLGWWSRGVPPHGVLPTEVRLRKSLCLMGDGTSIVTDPGLCKRAGLYTKVVVLKAWVS